MGNGALLAAGLWATGLLVAGSLVPAYSSSATARTSGGVTTVSTASSTLVQVNGVRVVALLALPLLAVVIVAGLLRRRRSHARSGAGAPAWVVTGLLGAVSIVGALSIGLFVAPVALLLVVACSYAPTFVAPAVAPVAPAGGPAGTGPSGPTDEMTTGNGPER